MWPTADHEPCPLTKSEGSLQFLHEVEDYAHNWLETTATTAFVKWMKLEGTHRVQTHAVLLLSVKCAFT